MSPLLHVPTAKPVLAPCQVLPTAPSCARSGGSVLRARRHSGSSATTRGVRSAARPGAPGCGSARWLRSRLPTAHHSACPWLQATTPADLWTLVGETAAQSFLIGDAFAADAVAGLATQLVK